MKDLPLQGALKLFSRVFWRQVVLHLRRAGESLDSPEAALSSFVSTVALQRDVPHMQHCFEPQPSNHVRKRVHGSAALGLPTCRH